MADTQQILRTDATLEELRGAGPRDELDLALKVGGVWWLSAGTMLMVGSYILTPLVANLNAWRLFGTALTLVVGLSHFTWMRRLPERHGYDALFAATVLAVLANAAMLLALSQIMAALVMNMLPCVMFAAYFLNGRHTISITALVTGCTVLPAIWQPAVFADERMASRLTVLMPIVWLIAAAIYSQNRLRREAVAAAKDQALTDPLTGVGNLRLLRRRAQEALIRERVGDRVAALLLLDLDELHEINRVYGHGAGDDVLRTVATALDRATSNGHHLVRVTGDLFALLIEEVATCDVEAMALRYTSVVRNTAAKCAYEGLHLEAMVGTAISPGHGETLEDLMTAADRSLYANKRERSHLRSPTVTAGVKGEPDTGDGVRLAAPEPPETTLNETDQPVFLGRPLHSVMAAAGWYLAIFLVLLSASMPDADRTHISTLVPFALAMLVPATLNFFFTPSIGSPRHLFNDGLTLAMIGVTTYLSGGARSPAWVLVFVFMIHEGWFMSTRQLAPRFLMVSAVISSPLLYETVDSGITRTAIVTALYIGVAVALEQLLIMGLNHTYLTRARSVAQRLAELDPLTGLPNRQTFDRALRSRLEDLDFRDVDTLAIVMLDLDGFRRINVNKGHGAGDVLLCEIAAALRSATRSEDLVARIGADEFAVIMPGSDQLHARILAERLVALADEHTASMTSDTPTKVTARAGFSLYPTHGQTAEDLVAAAELALLTVKAGGRRSRVSRMVVSL